MSTEIVNKTNEALKLMAEGGVAPDTRVFQSTSPHGPQEYIVPDLGQVSYLERQRAIAKAPFIIRKESGEKMYRLGQNFITLPVLKIMAECIFDPAIKDGASKLLQEIKEEIAGQ